MTPTQTARQYVKDHSLQEGIIHIKDWTRGGRGGWKTKERNSCFFVQNGVVAPVRYRNQGNNGLCNQCKRVFTDVVLKWAFNGNIHAGDCCPDCIDRLNLTTEYPSHPTTSGMFQAMETYPIIKIDNTAAVRQAEQMEAIA